MPPVLTPRLIARIRRDFGTSADHVIDQLGAAESGNQRRERVLAAIIAVPNGDPGRLQSAIKLSRIDWRDVLVAGGLANEDWPTQLDQTLRPALLNSVGSF